MDGIHDLGGKQGFGPINVTHDGPPFSTEWEARMYAISQTTGGDDWTIDWFRHVIELLPPDIYLNEPYFQRWFMVYATGLVQSGVTTRAEILGGVAAAKGVPPRDQTLAEVLEDVRQNDRSFARTATDPAGFQPGQKVRTLRHGHSGHTRLPGYARGATGEILTHHGAHALPDEGAKGREAAVHLYTVVFSAPELWGDEADPRDTVTLDLWESYLVAA